MSRNWKNMPYDEMFAIWKEYLRFEGLSSCDPLRLDNIQSKPMRLTPLEIIRLVEELIDRLEVKELME